MRRGVDMADCGCGGRRAPNRSVAARMLSAGKPVSIFEIARHPPFFSDHNLTSLSMPEPCPPCGCDVQRRSRLSSELKTLNSYKIPELLCSASDTMQKLSRIGRQTLSQVPCTPQLKFSNGQTGATC